MTVIEGARDLWTNLEDDSRAADAIEKARRLTDGERRKCAVGDCLERPVAERGDCLKAVDVPAKRLAQDAKQKKRDVDNAKRDFKEALEGLRGVSKRRVAYVKAHPADDDWPKSLQSADMRKRWAGR